jgi:hypothetical protein
MAMGTFIRVAVITSLATGSGWLFGIAPATAQLPAISVDGVSEQGQIISVNVTYSGVTTDGATINVDVDDAAANVAAHGDTSGNYFLADGSRSPAIPLIADDQFHSVSIQVPAGQPFAAPWIFRPGENVHVRAFLYTNPMFPPVAQGEQWFSQ